MTHSERVQYVRELEARHRAAVDRMLEQQRRYDAFVRQFDAAVAIYIDTITAPMRVLAEELRR